MKPLIGVTTYGRTEKKTINPAFEHHFATPVQYVDAVRRAGGAAVMLPPGEADVASWLSVLDGVILSGGADLDPTLYGGDPGHPEVGPVHPDRDAAEIALTLALLQDGSIPALFICRGMQILNVALGGTLHEHIEDLGRGDVHRCPTEFWAKQPVAVDPGTSLSRAVGSASVITMSGHHQGLDKLAGGLRVIATAEDDIVEAVEVDSHPFALAVQWHPEASAGDDPDQQRIFDALIKAASTRREAATKCV